MFFGKLIKNKLGRHSQKNLGWTQRRGTEKWVLQSVTTSSCRIMCGKLVWKSELQKVQLWLLEEARVLILHVTGRRCFINILIILNVFLKIKLPPASRNRAGKDHTCPVSKSAPSLLRENSAASPLLYFRMTSSQPNLSSQGDQQSPFLLSAAICIFEA